MPGFIRAQVALQNDTVMERDAAVNVFHFHNLAEPNASGDMISDINAALTGFYQDLAPLLSANLSGSARIKQYDLTDIPPRAPISDITFTMGLIPATVPTMPNEVAICLSYQGLIEDGINRRRNRGRIYLGPLTGSAVGVDTVGDLRVVGTARTSITGWVTEHLMPLTPDTTLGTTFWSVFSRANALGLAVGAPGPDEEPTYSEAQLTEGMRAVDSAWVDDAFDTQRRRGHRAENRTTVNAP